MITGKGFAKIFSLQTGEVVREIATQSSNWHCDISEEHKMLFMATESGLHIYSLPDLMIINVVLHKSKGIWVKYLASKQGVVFKDSNRIHFYDILTSIATELKSPHTLNVFAVGTTSDERLMFTCGEDKKLVRWDVEKLEPKLVCELGAIGVSMLVPRHGKSVFVGLEDGRLNEYRAGDFSLASSVKLFAKSVLSIAETDHGVIVAGSTDGSIKFPQMKDLKKKVCDDWIRDIKQVDETHLVCVSYTSGVFVVELPNLPEPADLVVNRLCDDLKALQKQQPNPRVAKYVQLIRQSLDQLLQGFSLSFFKGTLLDLHPQGRCLLAPSQLPLLTQGNFVHGVQRGIQRTFTKDYLLTRLIPQKQVLDCRALLYDFKRRILAEGTIGVESKNPLIALHVSSFSKNQLVWHFTAKDKPSFARLEGEAVAKFKNGMIRAYIRDSEPELDSPLSTEITVKDVTSRITSFLDPTTLVDQHHQVWTISVERQLIFLKNAVQKP